MSEMIFQRKFINRKSEFRGITILDIPIQPFLGMRIRLKNSEYKITEIVWDTESKRLIVRTDSMVNHVDDISKMKSMAIEDGWTIEGEEVEDEEKEEKKSKKGKKSKKSEDSDEKDEDEGKVTVPPDDDDEEEKEEDD